MSEGKPIILDLSALAPLARARAREISEGHLTRRDRDTLRKGAAIDWHDMPPAERAKWASRAAFVRDKVRRDAAMME